MFRFEKEGIKKKNHLVREIRCILLKSVMKSGCVRAGKKALAYALITKKKNKKKSIAYQTALCMETGHYNSRVNWGKLSRYSFKSTANKDNFSGLIKKTK